MPSCFFSIVRSFFSFPSLVRACYEYTATDDVCEKGNLTDVVNDPVIVDPTEGSGDGSSEQVGGSSVDSSAAAPGSTHSFVSTAAATMGGIAFYLMMAI